MNDGRYTSLNLAGFKEARIYQQVSSTMDTVKEVIDETSHASSPAPASILVVALTQSAGRGRQGRVWIDDGQVALSPDDPGPPFLGTFAFPLGMPVSALSGYSLAVGVALAEALSLGGTPLSLKWPNDLLVELKDLSPVTRKVGGILIEVFETQSAQYLLVGVGINLVSAPDTTPPGASLLSAGHREISVQACCEILAPALYAMHRDFALKGFRAVREKWESRSCFHGARVKVDVGGEIVSGTYAGVSEEGALQLSVSGKMRVLHSGHILGWEKSEPFRDE